LGNEYHYDDQHYDPPAPVMRIVIRNPADPNRKIVVDTLVDSGSDITCLPSALIRAIGGEPSGTKDLYGLSGTHLGTAYSYF
jgi:hypothetical protein